METEDQILCFQCKKRIYSTLTAEHTDLGLVCIVCQKRRIRATSNDPSPVSNYPKRSRRGSR